MKRVNCVGMVGRLPTPGGEFMFWDTGKSATPVQFEEALGQQQALANAEDLKKAVKKAAEVLSPICMAFNVYPPTGCVVAMADDGRILVASPYYDEKEPGEA